ncbi:30S ribosomal protein S6 [Candidatus Mycoplasma haematohominis]|uniref:Small ribosomal subunit protein bS6 n=1 Tax=Candidatus Mycoplasma haematohominis TaxID=1494318 RepID=A0A478FS66_9MOLU|nr:30S ribosomal protein S6 [Candidatus Mycoplasma haemohominis]GCE63216.1 30S ribosomal protein S6 [Candidatus Mycoplasma haemohominis]
MGKGYKSKNKQCSYEVMLVIDGDLSPEDARQEIASLLALVNEQQEYKERMIPNDKLAYVIRGRKTCHRLILNFKLEDTSILAEFNRLALLNKRLLRYLVINETKDRSFRARNNPKKIKDYQIRQEKYKQFLELKKNAANTPQNAS